MPHSHVDSSSPPKSFVLESLPGISRRRATARILVANRRLGERIVVQKIKIIRYWVVECLNCGLEVYIAPSPVSVRLPNNEGLQLPATSSPSIHFPTVPPLPSFALLHPHCTAL